jgi:hypothetical protein
LDGHSGEPPDDLPPVLEETLPLIQHGGGGVNCVGGSCGGSCSCSSGGSGGGSCDGGGGGSCGSDGGGSCGGSCGGGDGGSCGGGDGGSCGGGGGTFLNSTIPLARREDPAQSNNSVLNLVPQSQSTVSRGGGETRPPSGETRPPSGETRPTSVETRPPPSGGLEDPVQDTVGVVVLDRLGHVASSVSSGGIGKLGSHQF